MRIIGGTARGRRLFSPPDRKTRPTSGRVRESLFNILGERIKGARFLDLFCGAGAVGIEALSRGALHATFVDQQMDTLELARRNLLHCDLNRQADLQRLKLPDHLNRLAVPYHIIFADPPYDLSCQERVLARLCQARLLCPDALVIVESGRKVTLPDEVELLSKKDMRRYGDSVLHFYS
ncbi:MAG: 16S rRNA (guanine(966)-N(2))-methyltransferase RsmD [Candidatus Hydrogenedens sp.]|jgi:16S rRNA (guanine(966)-N(2))-methyltransferase RsmD|nr:16S rRNA (guanine(966)-N(2))-methyltransferase RsmD [Candidatus Hydrogenedens sp.]